MKDFLKRAGLEGPILYNGKGGYVFSATGKEADRGHAFRSIAHGYLAWNGSTGRYDLTDQGTSIAGLRRVPASTG